MPKSLAEKLGIKFTRAGQPRPHADSIYMGTVIATTKEEAIQKLIDCNRGEIIHPKQDRERWWEPYFVKLERDTGCAETWTFQYNKEYTG